MNIIDIFETNSEGRRTESEDNTALTQSDLRKTKLTLAQLNKLRIMNDVRRLEHEEKVESVKKQYSAPQSTADTI
jgi:hypothetical protein